MSGTIPSNKNANGEFVMFSSVTKKWGLATLCLLASTLGANAFAASVSATASVTDLRVTLLTLSNNQYLSDASTPFDSGFNAGSVLQSYNFNTSTPTGSSFAAIDNTFDPLPATTAGAIDNGSGNATVLWTFDWTATDTGTATLDVEYLFSAGVFNFAGSNVENALASSSISVLLDGTEIRSEALHYFYNNQNNDSGFQNMLLSFAVVAGQTGTFTVALTSAAMVAPVPLPAGLPLLGSGLLGLLGMARRRRRVGPA